MKDMKYHDNDVILRFAGFSLCDGSTFTIKSCCVTKGQDPDGCVNAGKVVTINKDGKMTLRVGRKGSKEVAEWWKANIPAGCTTFNKDPGELNFAVIGNLRLNLKTSDGKEFTMEAEDAAFAQGKSGVNNNWWFGGRNMANCEDNKVMVTVCKQDDNLYYIRATRGGNDVNEVKFDNVDKGTINLDGWLSKFPELPRPQQKPEQPEIPVPSVSDVKDIMPEEMQNIPLPGRKR